MLSWAFNIGEMPLLLGGASQCAPIGTESSLSGALTTAPPALAPIAPIPCLLPPSPARARASQKPPGTSDGQKMRTTPAQSNAQRSHLRPP